MANIVEFQQAGKEQVDAAIASVGTVSKGVQAIATAYADYSRKSFEDSKAFLEKLATVKSLDKAFELQTEHAKSAYELFMAEMTRIGELTRDLARETYSEAYKPFAGLIVKPAPPAD